MMMILSSVDEPGHPCPALFLGELKEHISFLHPRREKGYLLEKSLERDEGI